MENFDFLNSIGESKDNFEFLNVNKDLKNKIEFLEILRNRNLMMEDFKNEILDLLVNKNISDEIFIREVQKSIDAFKEMELKILSVDESVFKLKNDVLEYIGAIDRMPKLVETIKTFFQFLKLKDKFFEYFIKFIVEK